MSISLWSSRTAFGSLSHALRARPIWGGGGAKVGKRPRAGDDVLVCFGLEEDNHRNVGYIYSGGRRNNLQASNTENEKELG